MVTAKVVEVGTTPVLLNSEQDEDKVAGRSMAIRNGGSGPVWVGGPDVAVNEGWLLAAGTEISLELRMNDKLFAVVETDTANVSILQVGV